MSDIPVSYSVANTNALLSSVIPQFTIEKPLCCEFWCQGINDTYKVKTASKTFILRLYRHNWRTKDEICFEIDALLHLHKKGVNVAYPITTTQGDYIVEVSLPEGLRYAILTSFIGGKELDLSTQQDTVLYAQHVAQLHLNSKGFTTDHPRFQLDVKHLLTEPLKRIKPFLKNDDWIFIKAYSQALSKKLQHAFSESKDLILCHGDLHGGNTHNDSSALGSFDFDCCAMGLRSYDLAVFKWSLAVNKKDENIWQQFLESYQQQILLSPDELTLIDSLVSIRHIWLMGLHIDIAVAKGWLNGRYFDQKISFLRKQYSLGY